MGVSGEQNRVSGILGWAGLRFESDKREGCFCMKSREREVEIVLLRHISDILGHRKAQKRLVEGVFNAIR